MDREDVREGGYAIDTEDAYADQHGPRRIADRLASPNDSPSRNDGDGYMD